MDRLVEILAPKGKLDFLLKLSVMLLVIGSINFLRDVSLSEDDPNGFLINLRDTVVVGLPFVALGLALIGHLARLQHKLIHLASTDMLTGLPNRRAFLDRIAVEARLRESGTFLMIDLDHFKRINDTFGHQIGDLCLKAAADMIRLQASGGSTCARLGGEEFGMFLPASIRDVDAIADRLAAGLLLDMQQDSPVALTMSIGVMVANGGSMLGQVMSQADEALYRAKANGRARAEVWEPHSDVVGDASAA